MKSVSTNYHKTAVHKNISVDQETYDMLVVLGEVHERTQGAQVKAMANA